MGGFATFLAQTAGSRIAAEAGSDIAERAEESGAGPVLWVFGLIALIAIFAFMIKMRMDTK